MTAAPATTLTPASSQPAQEHARRRGSCPQLSAPMPTGDGLLVRMLPIGTIPVAAFRGLCAAARAHGNGIIEVTARGSVQVRGLNAMSALHFADAVAALDIAAADGIAVHCNALAGLDDTAVFDTARIAEELRDTLARSDPARPLPPKTSIVIDDGSALNLDTLAADIRVCAERVDQKAVLRIGAGGDATHATALGCIDIGSAVTAITRLLQLAARRGPGIRLRDVLHSEGAAPLASCLSGLLVDGPNARGPRRGAEAIGPHALRDGSFACGIGLAFGHADVASLERLGDVAGAADARGFRTAPGRVLMVVGLSETALRAFATAAERLGFIVRANDPKRRVVACSGAPICASGHIRARALAPDIARTAAAYPGSTTIHISGCQKGCAHPAAAALALVGTEAGAALIANGTARDAPFALVAPDQLIPAVARALSEARHG